MKITALTLALGISWPVGAYAEVPTRYELADLKVLERAFVELAEQVRPSVVAIRTYRVHDPKSPGARLVMLAPPDS